MLRLTASLDFHAQALQLRAERQRVLASNIANADTPGYVAREMNFAQALRDATAADAPAGAAPMALPSRGAAGAPAAATTASTLALARTHGGHVDGRGGFEGSELADGTSLVYARAAQDSIDRNTVDMDRERASMADNSVRYEAALRFLNGQMRTLGDAMRSPQQG